MNQHIAPCGHPGEPIIGTFVVCRRPECNGRVVTRDPVMDRRAEAAKTAAASRGADAAERAWTDNQLNKIAARLADYAHGVGSRPYPRQSLIPRAQCHPGASVFTYVRSGNTQHNVLINSIGLYYKYDLAEIRATMLARLDLDDYKPQAVASAVCIKIDEDSLGSFFKHSAVPWSPLPHRWGTKQPILTIADLEAMVRPHVMVRSSSQLIRVVLPKSDYDCLATTRLPTGNLLLNEFLIRCPYPNIEVVGHHECPTDHAVSYVADPSVVEYVAPTLLECSPPKWAFDGCSVEVAAWGRIGAEVALKRPAHVTYWDLM